MINRIALGAAIFALSALLYSPFARAAMSGSSFDAAMATAMKRMDIAMGKAPMTGNADLDFTAMMIPHHQGAIAMAESEIVYGHDRRLKRLAQEIIVTQKSEIQVMKFERRRLQSR